MSDFKRIINDIEIEINKTPSSELRNLLCDANIGLQELVRIKSLKRILFEGKDVQTGLKFRKVIDAVNRESAIATIEIDYPHLKWVMTTEV